MIFPILCRRVTFLILAMCSILTFSSCVKEICDETCVWSGDGFCDDGGEGAKFDYCDLGTDCLDCGTREEEK